MRSIVNPWFMKSWENFYKEKNVRSGIYFRFDKGLNPEVVRAVKAFSWWLRNSYIFPIKIIVYLKNSEYITAMDGEKVSAICFQPYDHFEEPYIKIAAGDYKSLYFKYGKNDALAAILHSIAHEITHYYQWINNLEFNEKKKERQACYYATYIIKKYAETRDEP